VAGPSRNGQGYTFNRHGDQRDRDEPALECVQLGHTRLRRRCAPVRRPAVTATGRRRDRRDHVHAAPLRRAARRSRPYAVTSAPGNFSASGTGSPIIVTGLTDGQAYSFTVTATNSAGTSAASSASPQRSSRANRHGMRHPIHPPQQPGRGSPCSSLPPGGRPPLLGPLRRRVRLVARVRIGRAVAAGERLPLLRPIAAGTGWKRLHRLDPATRSRSWCTGTCRPRRHCRWVRDLPWRLAALEHRP